MATHDGQRVLPQGFRHRPGRILEGCFTGTIHDRYAGETQATLKIKGLE